MNRRSFLQALASAGALAGIPVALLPTETVEAAPAPKAQYKRIHTVDDWGRRIGVGVELVHNEQRFRYASAFMTTIWEVEMTPEQREETYRVLERKVYELAMRNTT